MTRLGIVFMPRNLSLSLEVAAAAEEGGFWGLGICDSPVLYAEMYPVISACLMRTERLVVGPNVTNPVSRHWSVHAASSRTLDEMAPGRYFLGIASGDGAVHSVGLRPAKLGEMEDALTHLREASPERVPIQLAAGGPRTAAVAGRTADAMITGAGLDADAVNTLRGRAQAQRRPDQGPFETWALGLLNVVERQEDVPAARAEIKPVAIAYARHAFDFTFADKNVPDEYRAILGERLPRYDFSQHARVTGENPNAKLLEDYPEVEDYIVDRFAVVGTRETCEAKLGALIAETGIDGVWLPPTVRDPIRDIKLAADAFASLMAAS